MPNVLYFENVNGNRPVLSGKKLNSILIQGTAFSPYHEGSVFF